MQLEQKNMNLQELTLLSQLPQDELEKLVCAYKGILTLAKITFPFLITVIFCFVAFKVARGNHSDIMDVVMMALVACVTAFIVFVPTAFIKIYALTGKIKETARQHYWDENQLIDEFQIYIRRIIKNHYGVKLK